MKIRKLILVCSIVASLYLQNADAVVSSASLTKQQQPPNIVIILADDLGYGDSHIYNPESKIPTPNIDSLGAQGMRFTDAHTPSSVCTPTRYGLLTGRYAWRGRLKKGVLNGYDPMLIENDRLTIASMLKQDGYNTAAIGKWHLGFGNEQKVDYSKQLATGPNTTGFNYFFGIPSSLDIPPYVYVENGNATSLLEVTVAGSKHQRDGGPGFWREGKPGVGFKHDETLNVLTDKAVDYIQKQSSKSPFLLYFPLTSPHTPWLPTDNYRGRSRAGDYGDFVAQTDAAVGRVLKALDKSGLAKNTIVIFTSDNGAHWYPSDIEKYNHSANGNLRGQKADIWEGGHRVPFIVRWPGRVKTNSVNHELICLTDVMATVAAINGIKISKGAAEDSFNFLSSLIGTKYTTPLRKSIIHHSIDGTFAIRQGDWKLVTAQGSHGFSVPQNISPKPGEAQGQLYNLKDDPEEKNNLWLQKPAIVEHLTQLLEKYKKDDYSSIH